MAIRYISRTCLDTKQHIRKFSTSCSISSKLVTTCSIPHHHNHSPLDLSTSSSPRHHTSTTPYASPTSSTAHCPSCSCSAVRNPSPTAASTSTIATTTLQSVTETISPSTLPGWHGRTLPAHLTAFSSPLGRRLFREALSNGTMEGYFTLAEQFNTQSEPAYCGPSTLAMVLNALRLDPGRIWKGNWRWFSEEMLQNCDKRKPSDAPLQDVDQLGLSFEEMCYLAECNGANVQTFRAYHSNLSKFRTAIIAATTRTDVNLIVSFSRKVLSQTGCGHYSPIGGYHAKTDRVLVMDVARFKYPPYWVSVPLLWEAICAIDTATNTSRGYYLLSRADNTQIDNNLHLHSPISLSQQHSDPSQHSLSISPHLPSLPRSSLCRLSTATDKESWKRIATHFCTVLPARLNALPPRSSVGAIFREVLYSLPVDACVIFTIYIHDLHKRYTSLYPPHSVELSPTLPISESTCSHDKCQTGSQLTNRDGFSAYASLIPNVSPHLHRHVNAVPTSRSLFPLLCALRETSLFKHLSTIPQLADQLHIAWGDITPHSNDSNGGVSILGGLATSDADNTEIEMITLLLLSLPRQIFSSLAESIQQTIFDFRAQSISNPLVYREVCNLQHQIGVFRDYCACSSISTSSSSTTDVNEHHRFVLRNPSKKESIV